VWPRMTTRRTIHSPPTPAILRLRTPRALIEADFYGLPTPLFKAADRPVLCLGSVGGRCSDAAHGGVAAAHAAVGDEDDVAMLLFVQLVAVSLPETSHASPEAPHDAKRPPSHGSNVYPRWRLSQPILQPGAWRPGYRARCGAPASGRGVLRAGAAITGLAGQPVPVLSDCDSAGRLGTGGERITVRPAVSAFPNGASEARRRPAPSGCDSGGAAGRQSLRDGKGVERGA
jgi:hypothetical protein